MRPSRRRPPWWPEDESWPPAGSPWRRRRHRAPMFAAFVAFLIMVFLFIMGAAALGAAIGAPAAIPLLIVAFVVLVSGAQRVVLPVRDVIDATERLAGGDYAARVRERGPNAARRLARSFNAMAERLATAEETRRRLLADVTHELRTPMTVIQGQLEGLLDGVYPRDDAHLGEILDSTRVISRLVEDLRTLSLAESGALALHRETTDLRSLLEDAVAAFRPRADATGVALALDAPADVSVDLDPVRVNEVVTNLLANALHYTPAGGRVEVRASLDTARVVVSVRDTGTGIAADVLPRVFDRFYRGDASTGSGLGLAIAKGLVVAHGGEIRAESAGEGRGTTIAFTLPR